MSVIRDEYLELLPKGASLSDVVVLSQAWKKSHTFIRRHNWYADVLELDVSTIDLERRLTEWGADVSKIDFRPIDLLLVPAPKNTKWEFRSKPTVTSTEDLLNQNFDELGSEPTFGDWTPIPPKSQSATEPHQIHQKLRPLAHVSIRDQTLATAVMMCLAEVIETAQGDSGEDDTLKARERGTVSYGNRLHCRWELEPNDRPRALFSWGNSRTYRQYFQDYRAFLARPRRVCAEVMTQLPPNRELFVVSLDIKSFFDHIDRSALLRELKGFEAAHRQKFGLPDLGVDGEQFWERASHIFQWKWRDDEHQLAELIYGSDATELKLGLPQGLVASGFFANAYLIGFDRELNTAAASGHLLPGGGKVMDYCRYVDDIRIVVEAQSGSGGILEADLLNEVKAYVEKELGAHCVRLGATQSLELSPGKCTVTPYRSISSQSNLSALMDVLNSEISGTFDLESLAQAAGGLDGLLWMSDQIDEREAPKPSRLSLATVAVPSTDVRDDTVKRFVATRLAQLMRHRLAMTDVNASNDTGEAVSERVTNAMALAHEFESTARKLIKCWAENPSLALLLRCGMDLYPHPKLLAPVAEALSVKLFASTVSLGIEDQRQIRTAEWVVADLFRAGAVETGFRGEEEYPQSVDIAGYREELGALARRLIGERENSPWYLLQQAYLYLASIGDVSLAAADKSTLSETLAYRELQRAMMFEPVNSSALVHMLPLSLVAQQLNPNSKRFGVWLAEGLRATQEESDVESIVLTLSLNRSDLVVAALNSRVSKTARWRRFVPKVLLEGSKRSLSRKASTLRHGKRPLHSLMTDAENVFGQENGVLLLARALLSVPDIERELSLGLCASDILIQCTDWFAIQSLPVSVDFFVATISKREEGTPANPLYLNPPWVDDRKSWLYGLGRILRAALTGEYDFTSRRFLVSEDVGRYSGLRSTWFKRRFGLLNSGTGLMDEPSPVTPWLSGLLSTLLQWPGVEFRANDVSAAGDARSPAELLLLIEARISVQRALFGVRSNTPMYVVPTDDHSPLQDRPVRVAIVQPMRPRRDEFDAKDPTHWTPGVLAEHRRHLAEVCRLTYQKLRTWASSQPPKFDNGDGPVVDVVLFPELSVHPEHVFLLRRLSDKLRSNMFAGLTFLDSTKLGGPVNQGLWLIRTDSPGHGRSVQYAWQGKLHPMKLEQSMGVKGYRPHLTLVELPVGSKTRTRIAAAICYDATDLDLVADLRDRSDMFLVAALNQDVQTFDNMVAALHFHMYQPVILANSGEFGGSTAQAPLLKHERLIAHVHGNNQVAVSIFEVDPSQFKSTKPAKATKEMKTPPAGYRGRPM